MNDTFFDSVLWYGNPSGGETIGTATPAFSHDGLTLYVVNDATDHPLMAFPTASGPAAYWHNGDDPSPDNSTQNLFTAFDLNP